MRETMPTYSNLVLVTNLVLLLGFVVYTASRLKRALNEQFLFPWLLFWSGLLLYYCLELIITMRPEWLSESDLLARTLLFITSDSFDLLYCVALSVAAARIDHLKPGSALPDRRDHAWLKWGAAYVLLYIAGIILGTLQIPSEAATHRVVLTVLRAFSLCFFALRFNTAFPAVPTWTVLLIYLYGAFQLVGLPLYLATQQMPVLTIPILATLFVPLKIVLFSGVLGASPLGRAGRSAAPADANHLRTPADSQPPKSNWMPEPSIHIQLSGMWGFLFLLSRYPSGKTLLLVIVFAVISCIAFVAANLPLILELAEILSGR